MKNNFRVTAVVVTYQSEKTICDAMDSLTSSYDAGVLDCIVIDNNSNDQTLNLLQEYKNWATIIPHSDNAGFGRGCNMGLEKVETEYVLFVNPDSTIDSESVNRLAEFLDQNPGAQLVTPAITEPEGSIQGVGGLTTPWNTLLSELPFVKVPHRQYVEPGDSVIKTDWISGAVMIGRTEFLQRLNGFDPRFFLYFEETDLCRRILNEGGEIWCLGSAIAHHIGAASSTGDNSDSAEGCIAEHYYQSRFYYLVKHFGYFSAFLTELSEALLMSAKWLFSKVSGRQCSSNVLVRLKAPFFKCPPMIR